MQKIKNRGNSTKDNSCIDCNKLIQRKSVRCETCAKRQMRSDSHPNWNGNKTGYHAKHTWVQRHKDIAYSCSVCDKRNGNKRYHWANLDHKYRRRLNDYMSLCPMCHALWDKGKLPINLFEWANGLALSNV